jgi:putative transposase
MNNHIHIILKPLKRESLSKIMQWILSVFALRYNKHFRLKGHVWYDRFTSKIIHSYRQYITTFIYIARNPVRAKIVDSATEYRYNGVSFLQKGILDIMERPPNYLLRLLWPRIL